MKFNNVGTFSLLTAFSESSFSTVSSFWSWPVISTSVSRTET
jgi:hypothetical protein